MSDSVSVNINQAAQDSVSVSIDSATDAIDIFITEAPDGPQGPQGATGATGATGPQGPTGPVASVAGRTGAVTLTVADITDATTYVPFLAAASNTFTGKINTAASITSLAGFRIPHGEAPTSPVNGDVWTTTTGSFVRINGTTRQTATLSDTQSFSGNQTFAGTAAFTNTARPTAVNVTGTPAATDLINRNDGDARYIQPSGVPMSIVNNRLWRFRQLTSLNGYSKPRILFVGDSMLTGASPQLTSTLTSSLGSSGSLLIDAAVTAPAYIEYDACTKWITGQTANVPLGGVATYPGAANVAIEGNTLKIYYLIQPGGGFFKVESQKNNGSWVTESGYSAVSTAGTLAGGVISITKPSSDYKGLFRIRITGLGNNAGSDAPVTIISCGIIDGAGFGAAFGFATNSSTTINNIDNASATSRAITDPIFADMACNLCIISHYDGASAVNNYQGTLQANINAGIRTVDSTASFTAATTDIITRNSHGFESGQAILVRSTGTLPSPLAAGVVYYVSKINANSFKICTSTVNVQSSTFVDITTTGSGTHYVNIDKAPSWVQIGPPIGSTSTLDTNNIAQAAAMESLALSRGDAYFDNRKWAGTTESAIASGLVVAGDVHYSTLAHSHWVPMMVDELGLTRTAELGTSRTNAIIFRRGGIIRDRSDPSANPYSPGVDIVGSLTIGPPAGALGSGYGAFIIEDSNTAGSASAAWSLTHSSGVLSWGDQYGNGWSLKNASGITDCYPRNSGGNARLGTSSFPWGSITLLKSVATVGATGNRDLSASGIVSHGTVRFAAGSSTPIVVTNSSNNRPFFSSTNVFCQVYGSDATLTSVRVSRADTIITITPNAAATAETEVGWFVLP